MRFQSIHAFVNNGARATAVPAMQKCPAAMPSMWVSLSWGTGPCSFTDCACLLWLYWNCSCRCVLLLCCVCVCLVPQLPGVQAVTVNLLLNSAMVTLDGSGTTGPRDVVEAIDDAGQGWLRVGGCVHGSHPMCMYIRSVSTDSSIIATTCNKRSV